MGMGFSDDTVSFRAPESFEVEEADHYLGMLKKAGLVSEWRVLPGPRWEISFCSDYLSGVGGKDALLVFVSVLADLAGESPISWQEQAGLQGMFHPESGIWTMDL